LDPATGSVELVTQSWVYPLARKQLSLSADGRNLVYVQKDGDQSVLRVKELEYVRDNPIILKKGLNYDPAWSPDGVYVAYASNLPGNDEIYRVPWDHGEPERLTNNSWEWDKHPTWSPDGSQIVFFSNRDGGRRQLWIMNADGSGQRNLSNNEFDDWDPVWVR
jgi:TolB protein